MDSLLFTATSGATRALKAQHVHSNNLSNADTAGFRADMERVQSLPVEGVGFDGRTMVVTNSASTRFDAGDLIKTGRPLDVAMRGKGFFAVETPAGNEAYTRAGNINVDSFGVMSINGFPVLGENGALVLPDYQNVEISERGLVSVTPPGGGAKIEVGTLKRVNPPEGRLQKESDSLLHSIDGVPFPVDETVQLAPEHLEGSNVSAINELLSVMSLTRNFEMQVRMMKTAETLAQAGNKLMAAR
ncbi:MULTISPECIES: flagellar basal body rod protein FlgF [Vibrio]|uniref:flagellar basal body rod protein FlgF n=1 Tax=Vibrio TaxID=662 RepID=UPI000C170182|nr:MULTISPECIES: flagellar basal body rod protein FlgF [Vibrio]NAW70647.1 flagellar hook-basal body complex protein [Vibrio sp. V28_P6S34P95]NAX05084.1 flagellar hook-basal body complex protein [Vibrio sp. V30_P3S12P165]NAX35541.1 flagellar hook-basal body complex protein [Vibrio sp. V29_P1S30P107]NAX38938.1 flagellar hook-basal body complex protein [Vibrio sp. V27_P1S3P104]NAX41616.1 flagellar hook-basal body complex protein [Vibrio sp. V26_P1S5P106]